MTTYYLFDLIIARAHNLPALSKLPDFSGILRDRMSLVVGQTAKLGDLKNSPIYYFSQKDANFLTISEEMGILSSMRM